MIFIRGIETETVYH